MKDTRDRSEYWQQNKERIKQVKKLWDAKNPDYYKNYYQRNKQKFYAGQRESALKRKFGITLEDYHRLLDSQNNKCAICQEQLQVGNKTHVDHCHTTGRVRGILCALCNKGLGLFKDNPTNLINAATYLKNAYQ